MATMYSTTRPLMLLPTMVKRAALGDPTFFAHAPQPHSDSLTQDLHRIGRSVETACPDPL